MSVIKECCTTPRTCIFITQPMRSIELLIRISYFLQKGRKYQKEKKKKDMLKWALSNKTPTIKIKSSSLFFMTFIMFTGGCSPTELINLAIIRKKKKGP